MIDRGGRAEQAVAARRLDSFVLKLRCSSQLVCCSLGAAEQQRWISLYDERRAVMSPSEVQIDDAVVVINIHQQFPFAQNAGSGANGEIRR